jgi:hypothetical protein
MTRDSVIFDTNLLFLLVAGFAGADRYNNHKNLKTFDLPSDFNTLLSALDGASEVILTPNTLTETSNLLRQIARPARDELSQALSLFLQKTPEVYVRSVDAVQRNEFTRLGLTDAGLLHLAAEILPKGRRLLLTMDFDLYLAAMELGLNVINFNECRDM